MKVPETIEVSVTEVKVLRRTVQDTEVIIYQLYCPDMPLGDKTFKLKPSVLKWMLSCRNSEKPVEMASLQYNGFHMIYTAQKAGDGILLSLHAKNNKAKDIKYPTVLITISTMIVRKLITLMNESKAA